MIEIYLVLNFCFFFASYLMIKSKDSLKVRILFLKFFKKISLSLNKNMSRVLWRWALNGGVLFLLGCGEFDSSVENKTTIFDDDLDNIPNLVIISFQVSSYDKGNLKWIILSDFAKIFEKKQKTYMTKIDFKNYDEKDKQTSSALADYSILENDTSNITLKDNVVIVNNSGTVVEGKYFYWNDKTKRFTSPYYVKITKKDGSVISGVGFSANQELGDIEFKSKVSGQLGDDKKDDFFQGFE